MIANVPVSMATTQLVVAPQASTSQAPASQILITGTSNGDSQGKVNTVGNSVGAPLASMNISLNTNAKTVGDSKTTQTTCAAVPSLPLLTSSATAAPLLSMQTNLTTAVPLFSTQMPSNDAQMIPSSSYTTQITKSPVSFCGNMAVTAPIRNKPSSNLANSSVNFLVPQQGASLVNSITNAVTVGTDQVFPSLLSNAPQNVAKINLSIVPSSTSLPLSTVNNAFLPTAAMNSSTQVTPSTSSSIYSSSNIGVPWSMILPASNANISSQTQTVQSSAVQSTDLHVPPTSNLDTASVLPCSSVSLIDSVTSTAPLDTSFDICSMVEDTTAPSHMSPQSLQSMLQSMLSQTDAQLLWNTMLSSSMMTSPIFKLADTSNSTATTTCTATDAHPKASPVELGSEQFTSQPSHQIAQEAEVSQQSNTIPESIQDAFSDLNVQGVSDQDRLAEEVILSSMLSSKAKGTGSGYGLGININELLNDAGIIQDAFNP